MAKKTASATARQACTITFHRVPDEMTTWPDFLQERVDQGPDFYIKDGVSPEEAERYLQEDKARIAAFEAGRWVFMGVYASVEVVVEGTIQTLRTPGLWGIESDSDEDYLKDVEKEEADNLKGIMKKMGVRCASLKFERVEGR